VPIITAAEAGLQDTITIERERAVCAYVRSILDERIDARRCFGENSFMPSPPPPPLGALEVVRGLVDTLLKHDEIKKGGTAGAEEAPPLDDEEQYRQAQAASIAATVELIERLAKENFQLADALEGVRDKIATGRRLFEAGARSHNIRENAVKAYQDTIIGSGPLLGLDSIDCSTLCTALGNASDPTGGCVATATRMLNPTDFSDLSVAGCWLVSMKHQFPAPNPPLQQI